MYRGQISRLRYPHARRALRSVGMNTDTQKLCELIGKFRTAMLVTRELHGLNTVPMAVAHVEESGRVWFITSRESGKAHNLENDRRVQLIFSDDSSNFLTVTGEGLVSSDRAKIDELWKEPFKVWFPGGRGDPNIALIAVEPVRAEFWDNSGFHKLQYLWQAARAYVTGEQVKVREGEQHGVLCP